MRGKEDRLQMERDRRAMEAPIIAAGSRLSSRQGVSRDPEGFDR